VPALLEVVEEPLPDVGRLHQLSTMS